MFLNVGCEMAIIDVVNKLEGTLLHFEARDGPRVTLGAGSLRRWTGRGLGQLGCGYDLVKLD